MKKLSVLATAALLLTSGSAVTEVFLFEFGSQGSLDGQFQGPTGIAAP